MDWGLIVNAAVTVAGVGVMWGSLTSRLEALSKQFDDFRKEVRSDFAGLEEDMRGENRYIHQRIDGAKK